MLHRLHIGRSFGGFLPGFTGLYRVFTGFYWLLLGFTGFYWVFMDLASLSFTGFYLPLAGLPSVT